MENQRGNTGHPGHRLQKEIDLWSQKHQLYVEFNDINLEQSTFLQKVLLHWIMDPLSYSVNHISVAIYSEWSGPEQDIYSSTPRTVVSSDKSICSVDRNVHRSWYTLKRTDSSVSKLHPFKYANRQNPDVELYMDICTAFYCEDTNPLSEPARQKSPGITSQLPVHKYVSCLNLTKRHWCFVTIFI